MLTSGSAEGVPTSRLEARGLEGGYGVNQILFGVDVQVASGEIVAVVGHNGAGKSTLLRYILGLLRPWRGQILLDELRVEAASPRLIGQRGVSMVPQGGGAFPALSVRENLVVSATAFAPRQRRDDLLSRPLAIFPTLASLLGQRAETLSGGERQMLSLAMGIARDPRFLLLDEPSLGLSPSGTDSLMSRMRALCDERHIGMMVVEHKIRKVVAVADRIYVLRNGRVAYSGQAADLKDEAALVDIYL